VRRRCDLTGDKYIRDRILEINTKEINSGDKHFHENGKHLCNLIFVGLFLCQMENWPNIGRVTLFAMQTQFRTALD
jgi:hypothetical protein